MTGSAGDEKMRNYAAVKIAHSIQLNEFPLFISLA